MAGGSARRSARRRRRRSRRWRAALRGGAIERLAERVEVAAIHVEDDDVTQQHGRPGRPADVVIDRDRHPHRVEVRAMLAQRRPQQERDQRRPREDRGHPGFSDLRQIMRAIKRCRSNEALPR